MGGRERRVPTSKGGGREERGETERKGKGVPHKVNVSRVNKEQILCYT